MTTVIPYLYFLLDQLIRGEFKWVVIGAVATLLALDLHYLLLLILPKRTPSFIKVASATILVCLCVYFGYQATTSFFHAMEQWWGIVPSGPPMNLDFYKLNL